jgi:hypothetical protein
MATMLTESALFFLNLCNDYRDLREVKATAGVSEEWLKQNKAPTAVRRQQLFTGDSDDDTTAPEARSSAASRPSKKRITNSDVAVVARVHTFPSKQSRSASTSGNSEKVLEPTDVQTSCRYGGLEDEDDNEEFETFKRSPVKERGVRISDHVSCRYVCLSTPC